MAHPVIAARIRKEKGKGAARRLRKNNQIPAVFYGPKTDPVMLVVDYPELKGIMKRGSGENIILDLQVQSDGGTETRMAMLKDLLMDPVTDAYIHADFYEISMDKKITVGIPIRLINTPVGAADGGILQHIKRELTISCMPDRLIDYLDVDVSGLDIGDSLHVRDIKLPEGISSTEEDDMTIAVVAAPTVAVEEAVEGEVVEGEEVAEEAVEAKEESAEE
jgi:large subunit ribosomal protein L25